MVGQYTQLLTLMATLIPRTASPILLDINWSLLYPEFFLGFEIVGHSAIVGLGNTDLKTLDSDLVGIKQ